MFFFFIFKKWCFLLLIVVFCKYKLDQVDLQCYSSFLHLIFICSIKWQKEECWNLKKSLNWGLIVYVMILASCWTRQWYVRASLTWMVLTNDWVNQLYNFTQHGILLTGNLCSSVPQEQMLGKAVIFFPLPWPNPMLPHQSSLFCIANSPVKIWI